MNVRGLLIVLALVSHAAAAAPAATVEATPCIPGARPAGDVFSVGDGEWLVGGNPAVLAGVAWPAGRPDDAAERAAAAWLSEGPVSAVSLGPPDRWGRTAMVLMRSATPLQAHLIAEGHAVLRPDGLPSRCVREWLAAEASSRRAARGIWGRGWMLAADRPGEIAAADGHYRVVEGRISRLRAGRAVVYLNFGTMSGESLTVTLSKRSLRRFEASGMTMAAMEGRRVRVRGVVVGGAGRPRIEVTVPEAMERLE
ncbi:hypothetical protein [Alsobacter sp. R-9]